MDLTCRPPQRRAYERALKRELPDDLLLPYEWAHESDWFWRTFRVPAALLNQQLGIVPSSTAADDDDVG